MSAETRELIRQLKTLNKNIDILIKVTAVNIGKGDIFEGKEEKEDKVEILEGLDLSDKIIALLIGSTPGSVKSLRSKKKAKSKKGTETEPIKEPYKNDEQGAV